MNGDRSSTAGQFRPPSIAGMKSAAGSRDEERNPLTKIDSVDPDDVIGDLEEESNPYTRIDTVDPDGIFNDRREECELNVELSREVNAEVYTSTDVAGSEGITQSSDDVVEPPSYDAVLAAQDNTIVTVVDTPDETERDARETMEHNYVEVSEQSPVVVASPSPEGVDTEVFDGIRLRANSISPSDGSDHDTDAMSENNLDMYRASVWAISNRFNRRSALAQCGCIFAKGLRDIFARCTCRVNVCCFSLERADDIYANVLDKAWESGWIGFVAMLFPVFPPFIRILSAIFGLIINGLGLCLSIWSVTIKPTVPLKIVTLALVCVIFLYNILDIILLLWNLITTREKCCKLKRNKRDGLCIKLFDTGRILLIELLLYPILICDLFSIFLGRSSAQDLSDSVEGNVRALSFKVLFGYSCMARFFYAYFLRLVVLIYLIYDLRKKRQADAIRSEDNSLSHLEKKISSGAVLLQTWFTIHVAGQMVTQMLLTAAIALKMKAESVSYTTDDISISGSLWYMLVAGYILPILGLLSFFIPTIELVYEYFIGFFINLLSILGTPGIDTILFPSEAVATQRQRVAEVASALNKEKLEAALLTVVDRGLGRKTKYSLQNVFCYLSCIGYTTLLVTFFVVSVVNGPIAFYVVYILLSSVANFCPIALSFMSVIVVVSTSLSYIPKIARALLK